MQYKRSILQTVEDQLGGVRPNGLRYHPRSEAEWDIVPFRGLRSTLWVPAGGRVWTNLIIRKNAQA
jgi:hypothetical protein